MNITFFWYVTKYLFIHTIVFKISRAQENGKGSKARGEQYYYRFANFLVLNKTTLHDSISEYN